ncbi:MAG: hypothetical protein H7X70_01365 [Candidatus Kapabacteria bacterium]|nr:hypothetical protein [Candidatus Kapabacteria bacterium]
MIPAITAFIVAAAMLAGQNNTVRFEPQVINVVRDSSGYIQAMVSVFSVAGDSIRITGIKGSCGCATASVQRPVMTDSVPGKVYLAINAQHFTDSLNYVDFAITHTGANSPSGYRVVVRLLKDSR